MSPAPLSVRPPRTTSRRSTSSRWSAAARRRRRSPSAVGVSPPSVTSMLKKLAALKLVAHERYRGVTLTAAGRKAAVEVIRHHRLLEQYLAETLGMPIDEVHAEADRLEHALSEELEARIDETLGFPTHDPHGDPIPDATLNVGVDAPAARCTRSSRASARPCGACPTTRRCFATSAGSACCPARPSRSCAAEPFDGPVTVATERRRARDLLRARRPDRRILMAMLRRLATSRARVRRRVHGGGQRSSSAPFHRGATPRATRSALVAVFDGVELESQATAFRGGSMLAWYGGVEADLREADACAGRAPHRDRAVRRRRAARASRLARRDDGFGRSRAAFDISGVGSGRPRRARCS